VRAFRFARADQLMRSSLSSVRPDTIARWCPVNAAGDAGDASPAIFG